MSRQRYVLIGAAVFAVAALWYGYRQEPVSPPAPPVPRVVQAAAQEPRVVSAHELLDWGRQGTPLALVDTARDVLPNGLALTMLPLFVDWEGSELTDAEPFVLVRNVNVAGNPINGDNLLATVRLPLAGLERVEWCMTPTRNAQNEDTAMGHGQLRFVFLPDRRPLVLNANGEPLTAEAYLDDLVLSWEAWRPPLTRYDPLEGLDPESYALTTRLYSGAQRFLTDALRNNPWICYPLVLPPTDDAMQDLLLTGLLMGDALARRVMHAMVQDGSLQIPDAEALAAFSPEDLAQVRAIFSREGLPADPLTELMGHAELSYHLLRRSCITQSLAAVQLALVRTHAKHDLGPPPELTIMPHDLPEWVDELATADTGTLLTRLPGALLFVARNGQVVPGNAYRILDDAGLLAHDENGEPVAFYYHVEHMTPYGQLRNNMM